MKLLHTFHPVTVLKNQAGETKSKSPSFAIKQDTAGPNRKFLGNMGGWDFEENLVSTLQINAI